MEVREEGPAKHIQIFTHFLMSITIRSLASLSRKTRMSHVSQRHSRQAGLEDGREPM